jgi:PAS domain S-box-containing protein
MADLFSTLSTKQLYEAIVDFSDDAIVSKNLKSIVQSWNKAAERIFGYTAEEMIGQSIEKLFPADRLQEETLILSRLQKGERVDHFETLRQRKDGKLIDVSLTISPIRNAEGVIVGASKIARDITEQKLAQRRLAEAHEALKRADQMKTEFLTTLSHELRTPLNAILGWIQILRDGPRPDDMAEALPIMEQSARTQLQLIEDLLDMSRIESGRLILDIQPIDLATVVGASIDSVRPAAEAKNIRIHSTFSSNAGTVMGDQNRLQQIFWNLLSNALKFTSKGGRIHVVIQRVNSHVEVSVADNGQGIAPEFLPHVFDRFRQADGTTTRRYGGLGLGLSIVKHLAELHGGSVRVASEGLGKGATFFVSFPLQPARDQSPETDLFSHPQRDEEAFSPDLAGVKVLVVDDEAESVAIVQRLLERRGAEVRGSRSVQAALDEFAAFSPHVVVTDIGMPEHDGYELISSLRALPDGRAVPAIALTALARNDDRTRALRAGFQMHLPKPVDFTELVAAVRNLAAIRRS